MKHLKRLAVACLLFALLPQRADTQSVAGFGLIPATGSVTLQVFNTSANSTYTPNANLLFAVVECVGQGGGGGGAAASATGGSSGGGGGAGSYSRVRLTAAQIGASQAVTNTAAANGGATGNNAGTAGNDTSLDSAGTAGAGGVVGTGDFTVVGNAGGRGFSASITTADGPSGAGASGPWGGGAQGVDAAASAVNGIAGAGCGSGGSGGESEGSASTAAGGAGAAGCVLVTEFNSK